MKLLRFIASLIINLTFFVSLSGIVIFIYNNLLAKPYLTRGYPVGGDYFNALTYVNFFSHHITLPPLGWLPFWNEGSPIIGGYPWLAFYLMQPFINLFGTENTMELFAVFSLGLFFVGSLLLFWRVSKNWFIALTLTAILLATRASYYQLTTGGFIISASAQWYLPITLFFLYLFSETKSIRFLIIAGIFSGLSLLHHAPTSILMTIAPSSMFLLFLKIKDTTLSQKIIYLTIYILLFSLIGSSGIYTVFLQTFSGSGSDACSDPQCWGIYPKHLLIWMSPITIIVLILSCAPFVGSRFLNKKISFFNFLPALMAFAVIFLYIVFAHLKLINGLANVIFPTRTFWAANLFLLLIVAFFHQAFHKAFLKISYAFSFCILVFIGFLIYSFPPTIHKEYIATSPNDIYKYTTPKYKNKNIEELVPSWITKSYNNYRLDTFNSGLTQWWNYMYDIPSTRGYSDHPIGVHRDWQYYLQTVTREPKLENKELEKNRALFAIDAFGIGLRENSIAQYSDTILSVKSNISKREDLRDFTWIEFSKEITTPIVASVNSNAILFVGNATGYENFIRSIAMTNLSSFAFIPVRGPDDIGSISEKELTLFKGIICYGYKGDNWSKIEKFVKEGGFVLIDTAQSSSKNTPTFFPIQTQLFESVKGNFDASVDKSFTNINDKKFAPLIFENGPWKIATASKDQIKNWAKPLLTRDDKVVAAQGKLEKGTVVWSGVNLPYHIVKYENYDEALFLRDLLKPIISQEKQVEYAVERKDPRIIHINGKNISGIYFKENYDSGWMAFASGKYFPIYKAGLDFMYIPVDKGSDNITLQYNGSLISWVLFVTSILSFLFAILYLFYSKPFHVLQNIIGSKAKSRISKIVEEE